MVKLMRVILFFPEDAFEGRSTDYRKMSLERVPLIGERIIFEGRLLTVRSVTTVIEDDDSSSWNVRAS